MPRDDSLGIRVMGQVMRTTLGICECECRRNQCGALRALPR